MVTIASIMHGHGALRARERRQAAMMHRVRGDIDPRRIAEAPRDVDPRTPIARVPDSLPGVAACIEDERRLFENVVAGGSARFATLPRYRDGGRRASASDLARIDHARSSSRDDSP